jgi:predicted nucleic acid-binding protein
MVEGRSLAAACIDASFAVAMLVPDPATELALATWEELIATTAEVYAPPLFFAETTSVLRLKVHLGHVSADEGERAFGSFLRLAVRPWDPPDLQRRAWVMAGRYARPRAYDAQYLAVAEQLECDLWTADGRLANAVSEPWVKLLGAQASSETR